MLNYSKKNSLIDHSEKKIFFSIKESIDSKKYWYLKDMTLDSLAGISFEKASKHLRDKKILDTIIVAVIDTEINVNHSYFKNDIWINKGEISNNGIDDDNDGYIDDINGWSFISNTNGKYTSFYNFEATRVLKHFNSLLNKDSDTLKMLGINNDTYYRAKRIYNLQFQQAKGRERHGNYLINNYEKAFNVVKEYYPDAGGNYDTKKLDSLYLKLKDSNKEKANLVYYVSDYIKYNLSKEWIENFKSNTDNILQKCLNFNYDERAIIGDSPNINDSIYGSPKLYHDINLAYHSTQVTGIITNHNEKQFLKVMPIVVSAHGDENDKDIALAIKYAVNNGARVINISFGKEVSLNYQWVQNAIEYASKKDVLIVYAAGNEAKNVDNIENKYYPNDLNNFGKEIFNNFMSVGASTKSLDENLVANFSNFNKKHVDIFAPGDSIYVYSPDGNDYYNRGTSLAAPMVSKTAALILAYYPNLTASEVKQIIMESGTSYDIMVNKPSLSKEKELVPFSSLSKSGKIVNAYNALLMAEEVSKKKKRKK
ncbi:S8 family serine peptidase [Kordia sp.]|uniref:S8 family serine peptidase n=1 Tax=Kordia sp. TaxID=1965332 RepID=UPI003D2E41E0